MLKITEYAERLINDLDLVDYIERVKIQQKNYLKVKYGTFILSKNSEFMKFSYFTKFSNFLIFNLL